MRMAADCLDRIEERDALSREVGRLRGPKAMESVSLRSRISIFVCSSGVRFPKGVGRAEFEPRLIPAC